jgi:hypothetical protein
METPESTREVRRHRLAAVLAEGLSEHPLRHAEQVAEITGVLFEAFEDAGYRCTLVGGAAIEIHAPGIYRSGDIDVVLERLAHARAAADEVFQSLGFSRAGRHWIVGSLFVGTPPGPVSDPSELVRVGDSVFRIVRKEVVLADRIVGYRQWGYTAYAEQAAVASIFAGVSFLASSAPKEIGRW